MTSWRIMVAAVVLVSGAASAMTYSNPVKMGVADPSVARSPLDGQYYMVGTGGGTAIHRSRDLVNWDYAGSAGDPSFAGANLWAADITALSATSYVITKTVTHTSSGTMVIALASSNKPADGYAWLSTPVVSETGRHLIDSHVFVGPGGSKYLIYKRDINGCAATEIVIAPLTLSVNATTGQPVSASIGAKTVILSTANDPRAEEVAIDNGVAWTGPGGCQQRQIEGPSLVYHDGVYHLFYASGAYTKNGNYRVQVAKATNVTGPYTKLHIPLMSGDGSFQAPGHGAFVTDQSGRFFYLYHAYRAAGLDRDMMLSEMFYEPSGKTFYFNQNWNTATPYGSGTLPIWGYIQDVSTLRNVIVNGVAPSILLATKGRSDMTSATFQSCILTACSDIAAGVALSDSGDGAKSAWIGWKPAATATTHLIRTLLLGAPSMGVTEFTSVKVVAATAPAWKASSLTTARSNTPVLLDFTFDPNVESVTVINSSGATVGSVVAGLGWIWTPPTVSTSTAYSLRLRVTFKGHLATNTMQTALRTITVSP